SPKSRGECAPDGRADLGRREGFGGHSAAVVERVGREPCPAACGTARGEKLSVRFTIERMRTLVLAAGVLLVGSLVVVLAVGKWKNPFNARDLPKRLGIDIQQEANGYTFSHAFGAHSQYKIHASKLVQLTKDKGGRVLLHDVKIELYGEDGSRVDRIEGNEFEYDPQGETATAAGPVEITLMRPGVAPAVAPKATPGQVLGDKAKGKPLATAAG